MKVNVTLEINQKMLDDAHGNEQKSHSGHLGTHFDLLDKELKNSNKELTGIFFDVSEIKNDIKISDIDTSLIKKEMLVCFYTDYIEKVPYGSKQYFKEHPILSKELINFLIDKKVAFIGIDAAGIRKGAEHPKIDRYCADNGVFVLENLCNLKKLCNLKEHPVHIEARYQKGFTGIPCKVEVEL